VRTKRQVVVQVWMQVWMQVVIQGGDPRDDEETRREARSTHEAGLNQHESGSN
jgi:hypothetical protein